MRYDKQPLDYPDIIAMLKDRGLIIRDDDKAISCLRVISYFRLANNFHPMEADKVNHIFKPNSQLLGPSLPCLEPQFPYYTSNECTVPWKMDYLSSRKRQQTLPSPMLFEVYA